ncbi:MULTISPECIES: LysR family transcriptional regulator [Acetobacter]|uniref:DNA-binding transcriptional LysR family regulator n=1 Tax=Acetobacter lovaniensis TaxID=104100 RepID=A0A841QIR3_9PROT|nr:LysR family transcriptional regulator [Acetobacter lovaniensis]MBB6458215.1 DNA-binding transcriptional LysR family regulator [Acetobacter lovaniensis]
MTSWKEIAILPFHENEMQRGRLIGQQGIFDASQRTLARVPLVSLRQALSVAQHLNFRHAADALGVTQSSVSARIRALEETLGIVLFERRPRGVRLTEAGRRFVAEVSAGIEQIDHAVRTAGAIADGTVGRLAIGVNGSIASGFLADLRRCYRAAHPAIEQSIVEGSSSHTLAMIRDGKLDVAFIINVADVPDCHSRHLWNEALMIALPAAHPLVALETLAWADIVKETFLVRQGGAGPQVFEHIVRRVADHGRSPRLQRRDVGRDTLMHMVAAGEGITLTHEAGSHVPFPGIVFRPINDEKEHARFSAVWSPQNRSPALRNLLDLATHMSRLDGLTMQAQTVPSSFPVKIPGHHETGGASL